MGKPSERKRSAQRLSKRARARVKRHVRSQVWITAPGAETVHVKAGRKHESRMIATIAAHLSVCHPIEGTLNSAAAAKRPGYTAAASES